VNHFRAAHRVLAELGIVEPGEIDIEAIAYHLGAIVRYKDLQGCAARILGTNDTAIITVDQRAPRGRQRFSAAHEVGHWMHDRNTGRFQCTAHQFVNDWGRDNPERRANQYAAQLLLPGTMLRPVIDGKPVAFTTVSEVADAFETSLTAAAIRTVEMNPRAAMIVCTERYRRRWFVASNDVPRWLWPRDAPANDSVAHDLFNTRTKNGAADVIVGAWFDHADADRYELHEDARRIGDHVLSILSWPNEDHLVALMDGRIYIPFRK